MMPGGRGKIGFVLECGINGADIQVCLHAARQIAPCLEMFPPVPMYNKPFLLENCGKAASKLLKSGRCAHVFIIWDLFPSAHGTREKPSRAEDMKKAKQSLARLNVDLARVTLICIAKEMEAWLIADHRAVNRVVGEKPHKNAIREPDHVPNPKKRLNRIFLEKLGRPYGCNNDAIRIAENIKDCRYVGNSVSFRQFSKKLKELKELYEHEPV